MYILAWPCCCDPKPKISKFAWPEVVDTAHLHGALGGFKRLGLTKFAEDAKAGCAVGVFWQGRAGVPGGGGGGGGCCGVVVAGVGVSVGVVIILVVVVVLVRWRWLQCACGAFAMNRNSHVCWRCGFYLCENDGSSCLHCRSMTTACHSSCFDGDGDDQKPQALNSKHFKQI